ncbi:hypothetical protein [Kitasatospora sp. NPDC093558]|uniref:hypothetical protein n=1 Tax=Kitasatospora sp. NPDC093558 TaxID=3155201 RepID=UPI0034386529
MESKDNNSPGCGAWFLQLLVAVPGLALLVGFIALIASFDDSDSPSRCSGGAYEIVC